MKIAVGSLQQETNTFSFSQARIEDFEFLEGEAIFDKLPVQAFFKQAGATIIPTIYANTLPSGPVSRDTFEYFKSKIIDRISKESYIDGIWLYLHGAMEVVGVGSGEEALVRSIRDLVGEETLIAVALDFHANNSDNFIQNVDIVRGYRTAPHTDQVDTQLATAELLVRCIRENIKPKTAVSRPPLILSGDMVTTDVDPMRSLLEEMRTIESDDALLSASIFNGQPWVDAPNTGASVVVIAKADYSLAERAARQLAQRFWDKRHKFHFEEEVFKPRDAIAAALNTDVSPVFISDSGDNVTAGAPGSRTLLLKLFLSDRNRSRRVLVASIQNPQVLEMLSARKVGDNVDFELSGDGVPESELVTVHGTLTAHGRGRGINDEDTGPTAVVAMGNIQVVISAGRSAFISPVHFQKAGVRWNDYDIIVVKLGYLFPELRQLAGRSILALTPGASSEDVAFLPFSRLRRPIYPCDQDFEWDSSRH